MSRQQNVSADRFVGRCPECGKTVCMIRKKKDRLHPITEWNGECGSGHRVYLSTQPVQVAVNEE